MSILTNNRKLLAVVSAATIVLMASATGAYAYWTSKGAGTGTATVAKMLPLTIAQATVTDLHPGSEAPLDIVVTNPNAYEVSLTRSTVTVTPSVGPRHREVCGIDNFVITAPVISQKSIAAAGEAKFVGKISMLDADWDQDACQGAVITLNYSM